MLAIILNGYLKCIAISGFCMNLVSGSEFVFALQCLLITIISVM